MSQDLKGIKKWRTSGYIRPASIKAFLTVLLPQLTLDRARSLRPSLAQMPGDSQDTRPRPTAYGDIRGGLITWLSVARGALLFCRCGRLLAPSVKTRMQHDGVWASLMALITNIRARRISRLFPCTLLPGAPEFAISL